MRAQTIIATHSSTDFDALASMLAARRLYPGSAVVLQPMLARNVREFTRLYADELDLVEAALDRALRCPPPGRGRDRGHLAPG